MFDFRRSFDPDGDDFTVSVFSDLMLEPILEDKEVWIPGISLWHTKLVPLLPLTAIIARQDDHRRVGADPMSIRATPEREVEHTFEHSQIRERIVVAVVIDLTDVAYVDLRCIDEQTFFGHFQVRLAIGIRIERSAPQQQRGCDCCEL